MTVALELSGVGRIEKGLSKPTIEGIDLSVQQGRLVALVGADGAGKTTLMRIMAGILEPQHGTVRIFGHNLYEDREHCQQWIGYMPQQFGLYADLSVAENFALYADLFGLGESERKKRTGELLAMTDLAAFTEREAGRLSGGMKQKLGLACALLNHPKILLLDEPSVGADPLSKRELWNILRRNVAAEDMTVIVATTYMDEAALCDEVFILEEGRLRISGTPGNIASKASGLTFQAEVPVGTSLRVAQAELLDDTKYVCDAVPDARGIRVLLRAGCKLAVLCERHAHLHFSPRVPLLEDGYLTYRAEVFPPQPTCMWDWLERCEDDLNVPIVTAQNLVRRFGRFTAVDRTSFDVKVGEIFGLLGPNGAGKTTTFKMLCGLLQVTEGELTVAGIDIKDAREQAREKIGYMSQKFALYGDLSVAENLEFFAGAYGIFGSSAQTRIAQLVTAFDLEDYMNWQTKRLPGGIRQRLAMAVALVHKPEILFLDEPTSGADVPTRRRFWRWMTALAESGTTIIVTTHFMQEAQYCDRLLIQDAGLPLIVGTPEAVLADATSMDEAFVRIVLQARRKGQEKS